MTTSRKNLLFLCYGKGAHLEETLFALLTLRRFSPKELEGITIQVMTDEVEFFGREGIDVLPVSARAIEEWMGPARLSHRCKILALMQVMAERPGRWILVDGDTYLIRPPARLFERVGPGRSVMHMIEGPLSNSRLEGNRRLGEILEDRTPGFHPAVELAKGRATVQWNAGVVGIDASDAALLEDVLGLTDYLLSKFWAITNEQVSFSAILAAKTRIKSARDVVFHYNVSLEREGFRARLAELLSQSSKMAPEERARWLYERRIRKAFAMRSRHLAKDILNLTGLLPVSDRCDSI